jgi:hypothetical protein
MSTKNIHDANIILDRLLKALDNKGIPKHGRVTKIHLQTGFSKGKISDTLAGKGKLDDVFLKAVCRENNIHEEWVRTGEGDMLLTPDAGQISDNLQDYLKQKVSPEKRWLLELIDVMDENESFELLQEARKIHQKKLSPQS